MEDSHYKEVYNPAEETESDTSESDPGHETVIPDEPSGNTEDKEEPVGHLFTPEATEEEPRASTDVTPDTPPDTTHDAMSDTPPDIPGTSPDAPPQLPSNPSPGSLPETEPDTPTEPRKDPEPGETMIPPPSAPTPTPAPTPALPSDPPPSEAETGSIVNPYVPYTYEQMIDESMKLAKRYPEVITLGSIGNSVEGRELLLIKLGKGEKKIILCGSHHAREYISSSYLMKMVEEYSRAYTNSGNFGEYNVREILDRISMYIVPMVNPDGVNLVNKGPGTVNNQYAVETMVMLRPSYREWKANINGVDLNRQYPAKWEEKYDEVRKPASESFKGTAAATEPEVRAMMKLTAENEFILAASFHTKGNVIYWADRGTVNLIPRVRDMAKRLALLTKYQRMPVSEDPSIYGAGYENWFRAEFLRPAFCIELTPYNNTDIPHDDRKFDSLVWKNARYIGLFMADEVLYWQ
ncbi:MAG: M14 family zinc carboxypeptidase [Acetivibrionales bacterium]|jgi:hypothetical protein